MVKKMRELFADDFPHRAKQASPVRQKGITITAEASAEDEFVRLLAAHSSRIMSFIRILAMNRQDEAEEIFQLTSMVLWQKFSQYDSERSFAAWACRIAHFEMLKYRESKRRFKLLSDEAIEALAVAALPISSQINERRLALSKCLESLPDSDHELIRQRYFDHLSVNEISKRLGRSTHAIYRELSRIHGILLRCVERSISEGLQ
jgi:RNA polymerase sigma-70 factor (ECF subfamily)